MRYERSLSDKFNHLILKFFNYQIIEDVLPNVETKLRVSLALEYIRFKTISLGEKLRVHVHPKTDLDQRLSLYYIKSFLNVDDSKLEIIEWPELTVLKTQPFDIVVDISVSKNYNHENILVFDHHNGESKNTLEQLKVTIDPTIPNNLIDYVDAGHVEGSNIFEPQNLAFLKDYDEEKIIQIFTNNQEFDLINKFEEKDLYRKWKERKRKLFKVLKIIEHQNIHYTEYGKIAITFNALYNASILSLYYLDCDYFINVRSLDIDKTIILILRKDGEIIHPDIINALRNLSDDIYVYPTKSMAMVGSLYSSHKYINQPISIVYDSVIKLLGIKIETLKGACL